MFAIRAERAFDGHSIVDGGATVLVDAHVHLVTDSGPMALGPLS